MHFCRERFHSMQIAFDAKRAFTNGTGLGHYSRTLMRSLATFHPEHGYFACTPEITNRFDIAGLPNMQILSPRSFPATTFRALWRSSWVKKELTKNGIDLYHGLSHEIPTGMQRLPLKTVVTMHDLIFERYPAQYPFIDRMIYRRKFQYACRYADTIIAISRQTKNDLVEMYKVPEEKIVVCYQSCHEHFFHPVAEAEKQRVKKLYGLPDRFFLYTGSIIERKNLLTICRAMALLDPNEVIPLVVIGDGGSYKRKVSQYIAEKQLSHKVIFLSDQKTSRELPGYRLATDFPAIYQQALCMIYPSMFEGFGIPVLEALCSRIPVITSNISSMPEAGGEGALYISPEDEKQLATYMHEMMHNESLRQELIVKGWAQAQQFTVEKCAHAVMQVYRTVK